MYSPSLDSLNKKPLSLMHLRAIKLYIHYGIALLLPTYAIVIGLSNDKAKQNKEAISYLNVQKLFQFSKIENTRCALELRCCHLFEIIFILWKSYFGIMEGQQEYILFKTLERPFSIR